MRRTLKKVFVVLGLALTMQSAEAKVIEHIADRYIINVDQMDLNGEETLLDILMMCPDVVSIDGKTTADDMLGKWAVRIDNVNIHVNTEQFLKNTKASEIKKVKICIQPGIMKGCGGLKNVIDVNYRKKENGTAGKIAVEGDSYGNAGAFINTTTDTDNLTFRTFVMGDLSHRKTPEGIKLHGAGENVKVHLNWDITSKDNLELFAAQGFERGKVGHDNPAAFERNYHFEGVYTRDLGNGAYALFQAEGDYAHSNTVGQKSSCTYPYVVGELGFPFISNNVYMTVGIETGYSAETDDILDYTDKSRYEDGYIQVDFNLGKFNFSLGDRIRIENYWYYRPKYAQEFEKTFTNNHLTATAWYDFNEHNTLQATFARRFLGANQDIDVIDCRVKDVYKRPSYISEMRYTYQKQDFNLMGIVKNTRQELAPGHHDNTIMVGASSFWHKGVLRLTTGVNYFHEKNNNNGNATYRNFVNLKLVPQVSIDTWRVTSTLLYSSRKADQTYEPRTANFYADFGVSKELGERWIVEGKYHDMVGQQYGNRAVTVGATYFFGKK